MKRFGVTGGIGSGKSTVCNIFKELGIPVFFSDVEAKKLHFHPIFKLAVMELFGTNIYINDTTIDHELMIKVMFSSPDKLKELNKIVSPLVQRSFNDWCYQQTSPYILIESAILVENNFHTQLDKTIMVYCPFETRIQNAMSRDNSTREQVLARINNQMSDEEKIKHCDYVIENDGRDLKEQVEKMHQELLKISK